MHLDLADIGPAAGRYVLPLDARWAAVLIAPAPGMRALALVLDGELVEVLGDPIDIFSYLTSLPAPWIGRSIT